MSEIIKIKFNDTEISLDKDVLTQGIEKKEIEIKDENILLFTKPDYETRLKNEKDSEYKKGRGDEREIIVKESKRKLGLEFEGKDIDVLFSNFKTKIETDLKIEPDKKVKELNQTVEQLRENLRVETEKNSNLQKEYQTKEEGSKLNASLFAVIPDKAVNESISKNDIAAMFKANGYSHELEDGKEVVKFNGEIVKHKTTLEPLPLKDVMTTFVTEKKLIKIEGRGGGDDVEAAKAGTLEAFTKEMEAAGHKYGSDAYNTEMTKRIKDKTLKI